MPGLLPPVVMELRAKAGELYSELGKVKHEVSEMEKETDAKTSRMRTSFHTLSGAGKAITFGVVGAGLAIGGFGVEAASAAQVVDARLATAVKNAGGKMEEMEPKVAALDATQRKYGFTNDQTNNALATLTTSLKDPAKAMSVMGVAADLAKAKNIDLNSAALLVAKGMEGQTRPLKALGIDLPVYAAGAQNVKLAQIALSTAQDNVNAILKKTPDAANSASKAHASYEKAMRTAALAQEKLTETQGSGDRILRTLTERVKGGAAAFGDTLRGKVASAKAGLEDMGEKIGKVLIPIILNVIKTGQQWADYLGKNKPLLIGIAAVIGGVLGMAILAYIASLAVAGVKSVIEFGKMIGSAAAWVGRTVAGFATVIAKGAVWVATTTAHLAVVAGKWVLSTAKTVASLAIQNAAMIGQKAVLIGTVVVLGIVTAAQWAWNAAMNANPITLIILGIVALIAIIVLIATKTTFFQTVWKDAVALIGAAWNWLWDSVIKPVGSFIGGAVEAIGSAIGRVFGGIGGVIKGAFSGVLEFIKGYFNTIIGVVNTIIDGINTATGLASAIGIHIGKIPHLPKFATGIDRVPGADGAPLPAIIHGGEAILSNDMLAGRRQIPSRVVDAVNAQQPAVQPRPVSSTQVTIVAQTNASPARIASEVGWLLRRQG